MLAIAVRLRLGALPHVLMHAHLHVHVHMAVLSSGCPDSADPQSGSVRRAEKGLKRTSQLVDQQTCQLRVALGREWTWQLTESDDGIIEDGIIEDGNDCYTER